LCLGDGAIVRGAADAGEVVKAASKAQLGKFAVAGQKIVLTRGTILSSLAGDGIDASKVNFTGAKQVAVRQRCRLITAEQFAEQALEFLRQRVSDNIVLDANSLRSCKPLVLGADFENLSIVPALVRSSLRNRAVVRLIVRVQGREMGQRELSIEYKYRVRSAVTTRAVERGELITAENAKIVMVLSDEPEPASWRAPFGLESKRTLPEGCEIRKGMVGMLAPEVVIKRNQRVLIKMENEHLVVSASGKALEEGSAGKLIKILNTASQRIIIARVKEDGSVEPVF